MEAWAVELLRVAEALWPLVPAACSRSLARDSRYFTLRCASMAPAPSCLRWALRRTRARATGGGGGGGGSPGAADKERMAVLWGLCAGGHTEMARDFVGRRGAGGAWGACDGDGDGDCGLAWPEEDRDLVELIRSHTGYFSLMYNVCGNGHLGTAKWVAERFGIRETWEVADTFVHSLGSGRLDVAKWMADTFQCDHLQWYSYVNFDWIAGGCCVDVAEWLMERLPDCDFNSGGILSIVSYSKNDTEEVLKLCQWIHEKFSLSPHEVASIYNGAVLKWAADTFHVTPTVENLNDLFSSRSLELSFVEWLIVNQNITPNNESYISACKNPNDDVGVVSWLLTNRAPLTPAVLIELLCASLAHNNMRIASFLEFHYHIMDEVNTSPSGVPDVLLSICNHSHAEEEKTDGIEWFLHHTSTQRIPDDAGAEIVNCSLTSSMYPATLLLLEKLRIDPIKFPKLMRDVLVQIASTDVTLLKRLVSIVGIDCYNQEVIVECLTNDKHGVYSSKVTKWLVMQYHLEASQIKSNTNFLLYNLLYMKKNNCSEWLIRTFDITLPEILDMMTKWFTIDSYSRANLNTVKLLMRLFPSITSDMIRKCFLRIALSSPVTAQYIINKFPTITKQDLAEYHAKEHTLQVSVETRLWLDTWDH
ncbi:hypothetical protein Pelo_11706 [Pelomyxa schiedti]|nr:hypothetical protein Pelo_11706 [Pelomyxa schiedti]